MVSAAETPDLRTGSPSAQSLSFESSVAASATDKFSFVRIYQSGHEVPFYQPLVALELLNRTILGLDIATGEKQIGPGYGTQGTLYSEYVDNYKTVTTTIVPLNATYNTTTHEPNPPYDAYATGVNSTRMERAMLDARKVEA